MATVHLGRLAAEGGFTKIVAVKAMHAHLAADPDFRAMFLDEARTVARIRHTNVVSTLDVLSDGAEVFLVMDYVHGPALSEVLRRLHGARDERVPLAIASRIVIDVLEGLHAAHEATSATGEPLAIVHRDVSPHNILVGADGTARVMDFGIATAADRSYMTKGNEVKGKAAYMAPEQARGQRVDRRADVYAVGTLLFELLVGRTPFGGGNYSETIFRCIMEPAPPPSTLRPAISPELDALVLRALSKTPAERQESARDLAIALRDVVPPAERSEVAEWLRAEMALFFEQRDAKLAALTSAPVADATPLSVAAEDATERDAPPPAVARRSRRVAVAVAACVVVAGTAVAVLASRATTPPVTAKIETPPSATMTTSAPATSLEPLASAGEPSPPSATASARTQLPARPTPAKKPAAVASSASEAKAGAPPPPCCIRVAGAWQRYSLRADCNDNCPPGT